MDRPLRKLCLLGDFRVGKTALARRISACTEPPRDIGVQLYRWHYPGPPDAMFALFDVAGRSALDSIGQSFISGAEGFALIADARDAASSVTALRLYQAAQSLIGARPAVLMLNKSDLAGSGDALPAAGMPVFRVCAHSGDGVAQAFAALAERVLAGDAHTAEPAAHCMGAP